MTESEEVFAVGQWKNASKSATPVHTVGSPVERETRARLTEKTLMRNGVIEPCPHVKIRSPSPTAQFRANRKSARYWQTLRFTDVSLQYVVFRNGGVMRP